MTTEEHKELDSYEKKLHTLGNRQKSKSLKMAAHKLKFEHLEESFDFKEIGLGDPEWDLQKFLIPFTTTRFVV